MVQGVVTRERMEKWKIVSPEEYGFHKVIVPGREDCQVAVMYRLNLAAGQRYELKPGGEEMNGVCIKGAAGLELAGHQYHCGRLDSFYTAGGNSVAIEAEADCVFTSGPPWMRAMEHRFSVLLMQLPLGEIHQIHGKGVGQREVFMTLNQEIQASRLIAGLTWGGNGAWTSWPPHQHEADLEEIYCYLTWMSLILGCT